MGASCVKNASFAGSGNGQTLSTCRSSDELMDSPNSSSAAKLIVSSKKSLAGGVSGSWYHPEYSCSSEAKVFDRFAIFQWIVKGAFNSSVSVTTSATFEQWGMSWQLSISTGVGPAFTAATLELLQDGRASTSQNSIIRFRFCVHNRVNPEESIIIDASHTFSVGGKWCSGGMIGNRGWTSCKEFVQDGQLNGDLLLLHEEDFLSNGGTCLGVLEESLVEFNRKQITACSLPDAQILAGMKHISSHPRVVTFEDFLSLKECEHLIRLAAPHMKRSLVSGRSISNNRTSDSMFMTGPFETDIIVQAVERRVMFYVGLLGSNVALEREKLQVIRYKVGQEFKPHFDNEAGDCSKRAVTMLMFLTDVADGGETYFPKGIAKDGNVRPPCRLAVRPKRGRALVFWSRKPDGDEDPLSLHGGSQVMKGEKWLASKWITLRR